MENRHLTKLLTIWVEPESLELINEAALAAGMTRSSFIRLALLDKCPKLERLWARSPTSNNWRDKGYTDRVADGNRRRSRK